MNIFRIRRVLLDLLAQTADVNVHCAHITRVFISPDYVQKILTAVDLVRIEYKQLKDIKFLSCNLCRSHRRGGCHSPS